MTRRRQGFVAVVHTPRPEAPDRAHREVLDVLAAVVRVSRGGLLVTAAGPRGLVLIAPRDPESGRTGPPRAFAPIQTARDADVLADWLALGGDPAPLDPGLAELQVAPVGHTAAPGVEEPRA